MSGVDECEDNPLGAYRINVEAIRNLAQICKNRSARMINYSTDYVFGNTAPMRGWLEDDAPASLQVYGSSKARGEQAMLSLLPDSSAVIRVSWLVGDRYLEYLNRQIDIDHKVEIKTPNSVACPSLAHDVAAATLKIISKNKSGIFHVTNGQPCTRLNLMASLVNHLSPSNGIGSPWIFLNEEKPEVPRPTYSPLRSSRLQQLGIFMPDWKKSLPGLINGELSQILPNKVQLLRSHS